MEKIKLDYSKALSFISEKDITAYSDKAKKNISALYEGTDKGNDFLGWVDLPTQISQNHIADIQESANKFKQSCEIVVVIGIGGSYLGAKAVIESLSDNFSQLKQKDAPHILFAGQNISEDYISELRSLLSSKSWGIVVISKSGTTTEPAIAFRILRNDLEERYGKKEAATRIVAVTDSSKGALRKLSDKEGYKTYVIPDNVGGRYSVLTPVGLLPIAIAGFNISELAEGALHMQKRTSVDVPFEENIATQYAVVRNTLLKSGKNIEILANYNPKLHYLAEWWKQLYGESEGKEGKGIFPASVDFTSDLHSMGQYIQQGQRVIFETVLSVAEPNAQQVVLKDNDNLDGLNYLANKRIDEVNKMAELGTVLAHIDGGVPNIRIEIPKLNEYYLGSLIYFFEIACGVSGYMLGVNPFNQPGVEAYKKNMFALLEKPGFEAETLVMQKKIKHKII